MESMFGASAIPVDWVTNFTKRITLYTQVYGDNMMARQIVARRSLPSTDDIDVVLKYKDAGQNAEIVAKGSVPGTIGTFAENVKYDVFSFATSFIINERDLARDPEMQARNIDLGMRYLHRLEDDVVINGNSTYGIVGLDGVAALNEAGKVVASGATGNDVDNKGAWDGSETDAAMDPYEDVLNALARIDDKFANSQMFLLGRRSEMIGMWRKDAKRDPFLPQIASLLTGNENDRSFLKFSDAVPSGYAYLVCKDSLFAEMVHAQDIAIDANYPRQKGGNYYVEMREWLIPLETHATGGVVELAIT